MSEVAGKKSRIDKIAAAKDFKKIFLKNCTTVYISSIHNQAIFCIFYIYIFIVLVVLISNFILYMHSFYVNSR